MDANQGSAATRHPRLSLKFKPVWMLNFFFEKRDCHIWVRVRLPTDFQNCKRLISIRPKVDWRVADEP